MRLSIMDNQEKQVLWAGRQVNKSMRKITGVMDEETLWGGFLQMPGSPASVLN